MVAWFDYPVSMIGLTHAPRSNAQPPSLALVALGLWQLGASLLLRDRADRWLQRQRVWTGVIAANSMVMTFYLWNMSAVVVAALLLFRTGIAPQPEPLSATWWFSRPAWWLACAICLLPFLFAFRWAERPIASRTLARAGLVGDIIVVVGTAAAGAGLAVIAAKAFPVPGALVLAPAIGVALLAAGAVAVGVDPIAPLRHASTSRPPS
jgi:hypothetical protein